MSSPVVPLISEPTRAPGARAALALLLTINLFNYIDRYILAAVLKPIEVDAAFAPISKAQLGWLTSAFVISYLAFSPIFGWLGDRMSRWLLVGFGVILWSLASGGTGLAPVYIVLLLTRALVGIGEAAYGPVAPALLSDLYPVRMRGWVMAWFYAAIPVGSALGYLFGGVISEQINWRWAFYLVVPPGVILGIICFLMREPARGQADAAASHVPASLRDCLCLVRIPSYVYNTVAATAFCFSVGGVAVWMPTYIYEREGNYIWTDEVKQKLGVRPATQLPTEMRDRFVKLQPATTQEMSVKEMDTFLAQAGPGWKTYRAIVLEDARAPSSADLDSVNAKFGGILALGGLIATLAGGWVGDRLRERFPGSYFLVSGWSMLISIPLFLGVLVVPFPYAWGLLFLAILGMFFNTGPSNTILANVAPPTIRSSAFAINILVIHILGDAISPGIIGMIADWKSLDVAFLALSAASLLSALSWLFGTRHLQRDTAAAPTLLANS